MTSPDQPSPDLIDQLRGAIEASGMTKRDIARAAGTSDNYLAQVLSRVRVPSVSMVERLAAACGARLAIVPERGEAAGRRTGAKRGKKVDFRGAVAE